MGRPGRSIRLDLTSRRIDACFGRVCCRSHDAFISWKCSATPLAWTNIFRIDRLFLFFRPKVVLYFPTARPFLRGTSIALHRGSADEKPTVSVSDTRSE